MICPSLVNGSGTSRGPAARCYRQVAHVRRAPPAEREPFVDGSHIDLTAIVALALGGVAVYIAYRDVRLGTAIGIGVAVVTLLWLLLNR